MAEWQLVEYEPKHAAFIIEANLRNQERWLSDPEAARFADDCRRGGPAYTLLVNDVPVACAGIILQPWNRGEAWSLLSSLFYSHKIKVFRAMKAGIEALIAEHRLKRVQALVNPKYQSSIDFIECFGFEFEGNLRQYGPDGDYLMYSRVQIWQTP